MAQKKEPQEETKLKDRRPHSKFEEFASIIEDVVTISTTMGGFWLGALLGVALESLANGTRVWGVGGLVGGIVGGTLGFLIGWRATQSTRINQ